MTDTDSGGDAIPSAGTSSTDDARAETKKVSSEILDMIGIKGRTSEPGPGVTGCGGDEDRDRFFRTRHPWSLTPSSGDQLDGVMEGLKEKLPEAGWKIISYGPDSSRNKNLSLTADNDKKRFSVNVTRYAEDSPPKLVVEVVSGCYEVPEGQRVDTY